MKPFSKFEAISGKPVVTRNGKRVTQIKEFEVTGLYPIAGVVEGKEKEIMTFTDDGRCADKLTTPYDLFMMAKKHEGWVAFGPEKLQLALGSIAFTTHAFPTEEKAKQSYRGANNGHEPVGTVYISWEE